MARGQLSSIGACLDIGNAVTAALRRFERTGEAFCGSTNPLSGGDGPIMCLAPVPVAFLAAPLSRTTAASPPARLTRPPPPLAPGALAALLASARDRRPEQELLAHVF